jgi:hypothetical protein
MQFSKKKKTLPKVNNRPMSENSPNLVTLTLRMFLLKKYLSFQYTNNAYYVNYTQQHCYVFPKNLITLAGFKPGSSIPEATPPGPEMSSFESQ